MYSSSLDLESNKKARVAALHVNHYTKPARLFESELKLQVNTTTLRHIEEQLEVLRVVVVSEVLDRLSASMDGMVAEAQTAYTSRLHLPGVAAQVPVDPRAGDPRRDVQEEGTGTRHTAGGGH